MNFGNVMKAAAVSAFAFSVAHASAVQVVPGELIVKLKEGANKSLFANKALGVELQREISLSYGTLYVVKHGNNKDMKSVQQALNSNPAIEYAEPNFIYSIVKPVEELTVDNIFNTPPTVDAPNDPKFGDLWGLANTGNNEPGGSAGTAGADVNALAAWAITKGDKNVKIAVIDTGIDYRHPDLKDNMWTNPGEIAGNGIDDDGNGYIDDVHGYDFANGDGDPLDGHSHGTHCAGTIGAVHNNGEGVAGVMADVTLVAVKFLTDSGSGTTENAIKSIDYATKVGVDLMSNSWGGGGFSQALKDAIVRASDAGIVFTAAAGNSSTNNDSSPHYPSNYQVPNVISVAAHTAQDDLAYFSCYGRRTVHIAAPGHKIMSTVKNGGYQAYSGTSMATPHVSGVIGLLLAQEGRMDHIVLKDRVLGTSVPVASLRGKTINAGRINAYNLLTDTRPERKEPKPDQWKTLTVNTWESAHPYPKNHTDERTFNVPGAKYIRLVVAKYELEKKYDTLTVSDGNNRSAEKISGAAEDYKSEYVEGETMKVVFKSDRSVEKWGFKIEAIEWQ